MRDEANERGKERRGAAFLFGKARLIAARGTDGLNEEGAWWVDKGGRGGEAREGGCSREVHAFFFLILQFV